MGDLTKIMNLISLGNLDQAKNYFHEYIINRTKSIIAGTNVISVNHLDQCIDSFLKNELDYFKSIKNEMGNCVVLFKKVETKLSESGNFIDYMAIQKCYKSIDFPKILEHNLKNRFIKLEHDISNYAWSRSCEILLGFLFEELNEFNKDILVIIERLYEASAILYTSNLFLIIPVDGRPYTKTNAEWFLNNSEILCENLNKLLVDNSICMLEHNKGSEMKKMKKIVDEIKNGSDLEEMRKLAGLPIKLPSLSKTTETDSEDKFDLEKMRKLAGFNMNKYGQLKQNTKSDGDFEIVAGEGITITTDGNKKIISLSKTSPKIDNIKPVIYKGTVDITQFPPVLYAFDIVRLDECKYMYMVTTGGIPHKDYSLNTIVNVGDYVVYCTTGWERIAYEEPVMQLSKGISVTPCSDNSLKKSKLVSPGVSVKVNVDLCDCDEEEYDEEYYKDDYIDSEKLLNSNVKELIKHKKEDNVIEIKQTLPSLN